MKKERIDIRPKLLATFRVESREHLARIREILAAPGGLELDEAFRRAHSLKGAARAVDLAPVEKMSHRLETMLSRLRDGAVPPTAEIFDLMQRALDTIEDLIEAALGNRRLACPPSPETDIDAAIDAFLGIEHAPTTTASPVPGRTLDALQTVRVNADHIDRLLRSAGQLSTEYLKQDLVSNHVRELGKLIAEIEKEWDAARHSSLSLLRNVTMTPLLAPIARFLDFMDHQTRFVSSRMRTLRMEQQRSAHSIKTLGQEIHRDALRARMVSVESVFEGFPRMVRDLARDQGKELEFRATGFDVEADRLILQALKDPMMHILRNAVTHGIEPASERTALGKNPTGRVSINVESRGGRLLIRAEDDGRGIDLRQIADAAVRRGLLTGMDAETASPGELTRLLYQAGFTTTRMVTELAGRGMGLSVVWESVLRLQGEVEIIDSGAPGTGLPGTGLPGMALLISVPLLVSTHRVLLVDCRGQMYALPLHSIERLLHVDIAEVRTIEGHSLLRVGDDEIPIVALAELLRLQQECVKSEENIISVIVVRAAGRRVALAVDAFLSEMDALIQDAGPRVTRTGMGRHIAGKISGGILLGDGSISWVLNPAELVNVAKRKSPSLKTEKPAQEKAAPTILVVDDSLTTRSLEKSILEAHGYTVLIAVDGIEALAELRAEHIDLVVADIQMPRLDGFGLLEAMKKDERLAKIPVIIVTSVETHEDQERGLLLGADAYLIKRKFDQKNLLDTIRQILP